jgi:hypothetical protein
MVLSACLILKWDYGLRQIQYTIYNFGHDVTLSIINFFLKVVQLLKSRLELKCLVACVVCAIRPLKLKKNVIWTLLYSIDQEFHVDDENTRESQF